MNTLVLVIILAVFQGIAEFLPISSSGHLVLLGRLFGLPQEAGFAINIVLHVGSLIAIFAFYWQRIWNFLRLQEWRIVLMVIIGTIPAGVGGVLLKKSGLADRVFSGENLLQLGFAFLVTGALLRLTAKPKLTAQSDGENGKSLEKLSFKQAVIVGFAQLFAILPGISRSGSTIAAGILSGIKREAAAEFSFLLALPAIAGAALLEVLDAVKAGHGELKTLFSLESGLGLLVSAAVSFCALKLLLKIIRKGKLVYFAYYLFLLGAAVIIWYLRLSMTGK